MKENTLSIISSSIIKDVQIEKQEVGLLNGTFGELLFLFEYYNGNNYSLDPLISLFNDYMDSLSEGKRFLTYSYCSGIAGIGISIDILLKRRFIELENENYLQIFDRFLLNILKNNINKLDWDFLHGSLGIGFYFLKRYTINKKISEEAFAILINYFLKTAVQDKYGIKWEKITDNMGKIYEYNISMSHGMTSLLLFFTRMIEITNRRKEEIEELLRGGINYLFSQQIDHDLTGCYFTSVSLSQENRHIRSRLAWCYGDLMIAYAIWYAGTVLNESFYKNYGRQMLISTSFRRDLMENQVYDVGICHGTAGLSIVFDRLYRKMNVPEFKDASDFWKDQTLTIGSQTDYKCYNPKEDKWSFSESLLEGIAGVGFSLLDSETCIGEILLTDF